MLIIDKTSDQASSIVTDIEQDSQQATLANTVSPSKTGVLQSIFRMVRKIIMNLGILLGSFSIIGSLFGLFGVIIVGVVLAILAFVGWRMSVAEEKQEKIKQNSFKVTIEE